MHAGAWEALLRHIPSEIYEKLMVVTGCGTQITVQTILRIDRHFFAFKGRLAGSQDAGRLFFLPYSQIDYLGFQQGVKDAEYEAWFGSLVIPDRDTAEAAQSSTTDAASEAKPAPAETANGADVAAEAASPPSSEVTTVIKSAVLERFRSRGHGSGVRPRVKIPKPPSGQA
jgi:hypothetical protein